MPIDGNIDPSAWKSSDLQGRPSSWTVSFSQAELDELDRAMSFVRKEKLGFAEIDRNTFQLKLLGKKLESCLEEITDGRGFVLLTGLPIDNYTQAEAELLFWGIGKHVGSPLQQNSRGDFISHIKDVGRKQGQLDVRGSQTNAHMGFHTDSADIVGLLCLRKAKSGGLSSIVSSTAIYEAIRENHPEHLEILERGFFCIVRDAALSEIPISPWRYPVFVKSGSHVSCRYIPFQIQSAFDRAGISMSREERAALDCLDHYASHPDYRLDMDMNDGDIQLINNYTTLHSRTEFEDWPEDGRKRHLLRLWLNTDVKRRQFPDSWVPYSGNKQGQPSISVAEMLRAL